MAAPSAREQRPPGSRPGALALRPPPGLIASTRRRNRRLDWLLLRWQARLDARWADRVVPWAIAFVVFVVYAAVALARIDRLEAGPTLARHVQGAWHLAAGRSPEVTVGGGATNLFGDGFPALFVPLAAFARLLPVAGTLVVAQAAMLAVGVVPVWLLARNVAHLRVGAAAALAVAYAVHPTVADLDLGDFNPQALALAPLLLAAYYAETRRPGRFALAAAVAMLWSAELGLVVAVLGLVLMAEGERRLGGRAAIAGAAWTFVALFAVQSPLGRTGLIAPGAFDRYGDGGLDVLIEMLRNPFRPVVDVFGSGDVRVLAGVFGPLLFLPLGAIRKLVPALPLTALTLVADVPVTGPNGGARMVPLLAFSFVAATFALGRLGRPSVERVIVDRRLLVVVAIAAIAAMLTRSPLSPYEHPWELDGPREEERRAALAEIPPVVPVRVPAYLAAPLAERADVQVLDRDERDVDDLIAGVDVLVLDESYLDDLDAAGRHMLRLAVVDEGFAYRHRQGRLTVFVRVLDG